MLIAKKPLDTRGPHISEIRRLPPDRGPRGESRAPFYPHGHDWSGRYPWIVESAMKHRHKQFVIDGEAVLLGVDGISDFNALHARQRDEEVQLYAFDFGLTACLP